MKGVKFHSIGRRIKKPAEAVTEIFYKRRNIYARRITWEAWLYINEAGAVIYHQENGSPKSLSRGLARDETLSPEQAAERFPEFASKIRAAVAETPHKPSEAETTGIQSVGFDTFGGPPPPANSQDPHRA